MKCPHCAVHIHPQVTERDVLNGDGTPALVGGLNWKYAHMECPGCRQAVFWLLRTNPQTKRAMSPVLVFPKGAVRPPAPKDVPNDIAQDFNEARLVLSDSPKASAALSRRCLQAILRDQGFNQRDLAPAIDAVLAANRLPAAVAENLDAIRNIGNFAAHPTKSTNSGEVMNVEPHEAEWNLEVLEQLFDAFYVQPAIARARRDALNAKLQDAGKPPMK